MAQVNGLAAVVSDRYAEQAIILQTSTDVDGDQALSIALPAGLGEVLISEVQVDVSSIATMLSGPELRGPTVRLTGAAGTLVDFVGSWRWQIVSATRVIAECKPDTAVIWKEDELLRVIYQEVDTNAAPTADCGTVVRCRRLRVPVVGTPEGFRLTS